MRTKVLVLIVALAAYGRTAPAELNMDWAYHSGGGADSRATENVPGQGFTFLGNGTNDIKDADPVTLYVLTANRFANGAEEQVFARWWNGKEEKWVMGSWVTNVYLGSGDTDAGRFHGQPADKSAMCDVWKIVISPDITLPGDNYYTIQLKGWTTNGTPSEAFLLRDPSPKGKQNNIGQAYTTEGDYVSHDWSLKIGQ